VLTNKQTNKPTNKQTPMKTSNALRYATTLGNKIIDQRSADQIRVAYMMMIHWRDLHYNTECTYGTPSTNNILRPKK